MVIGRWVTVLMAVLGVAAAPLVGLSVTIWYYLQFISAYLSVPMAAVILTGLLWKKGNTKGAIGGLIAGFSLGMVVFLDQVLHLGLPILSHPIFHSFMHRDLVVLVVAAIVMVVVSHITSQTGGFQESRGQRFGGIHRSLGRIQRLPQCGYCAVYLHGCTLVSVPVIYRSCFITWF